MLRGFGCVIRKCFGGAALYVPAWRSRERLSVFSTPLSVKAATESFQETPPLALPHGAVKRVESDHVLPACVLFHLFKIVSHVSSPTGCGVAVSVAGIMVVLFTPPKRSRDRVSLRHSRRRTAYGRGFLLRASRNPGRAYSRSWRCCCWRCPTCSHSTHCSRCHGWPSAGERSEYSRGPYMIGLSPVGFIRFISLSLHARIWFLTSAACPIQYVARLDGR